MMDSIEITAKRAQAGQVAIMAVAALHYGADVESISTCPQIEGEHWTPWVYAHDYFGRAARRDWMEIGICAALVVEFGTVRAAKGILHFPYDVVELEGLQVAAEIVRFEPEQCTPRHWIWERLCSDWWGMPKGKERQECMAHAEAEFMDWWRAAMEILPAYGEEINDLARILKEQEGMERKELQDWWQIA